MRFAIALAPFLVASAEIRVKTFPDYRLHIANDRYRGEWQIRLPEVVAAREGVFLTSVRPSLEWSTSPQGVYSYTWTSTPEYAKRATEAMGSRQRMASGIEVSTRASVLTDRVDLRITLRNPTDRTIHAAWIDGGCLTHMTERFFDDDHSRTFIFTRDGLTPVSKLDRTIAVRTKYFVHPAWFDEEGTQSYEFFWGRSSAIPTEALIVSKAVTGSGAVGIAWEKCPGLRQNSDASHRCMHSSSYFGDLPPGASMTRRGALLFGDTVDEVVAAYREGKFSMYSEAPNRREQR